MINNCQPGESTRCGPRDVHILNILDIPGTLMRIIPSNDRMAGRKDHYAQKLSHIGDLPGFLLVLSDLSWFYP